MTFLVNHVYYIDSLDCGCVSSVKYPEEEHDAYVLYQKKGRKALDSDL